MNPIYSTNDATLHIKYKSSSKIQVLINDKILESKKVISDKTVYEEFSNLSYETVTIKIGTQCTTLKLTSFITAYDLDTKRMFTFDFGDPFAIIYVNNLITGPVKTLQAGQVMYNPFMPPLTFSAEADLFFIPLEPGFAPVFTVRKKQFEHSSPVDRTTQDFNHGDFCYQFMEWTKKIDFDTETTHSIQSLDIPNQLKIGHRGCGGNYSYIELAKKYFKLDYNPKNHIAENTIFAFNEAYKRIDGVELDIILTRDMVPVINHDFGVDHDLGKLAINSLTAEQFQKIQIQRTHQIGEHQTSLVEKIVENEPVRTLWNENLYHIVGDKYRPTFAQVLNETNEGLMINVEIKYNAACSESVGQRYFSRVQVIEQTLKCIQDNKQHPIYFSTFDPVCALILKYAQNKYPVFHLNCGMGIAGSHECVDMTQKICVHVQNGIDFAKRFGLQGIVTSLHVVFKMIELVKYAVAQGLEVFSWGTLPCAHDWIQIQTKIGMKGIIYDMVTMFDQK
ncbi:Glycerophosphoryl_diester phosphodiesterase family protein [Hexamita inflata]|uniref:Glycerophosphoryl diester phosphodiesterase family protein n=1 Tax=Hexamita inflata TaxID=28002 RepID=A0AA86UNW2_9EUKA|nr:Glycerophosphoryl diester phosphodiesterase family protein [Hexamita inflata]